MFLSDFYSYFEYFYSFRTGFVVDKKKKRAPKPEATEEGEKTE